MGLGVAVEGDDFFDGCEGKKRGRAGQGGESAADGTKWSAVTGSGGGAAASPATAPHHGRPAHGRARDVPVKASLGGGCAKMAGESGGRGGEAGTTRASH